MYQEAQRREKAKALALLKRKMELDVGCTFKPSVGRSPNRAVS